jgi:hypothetical protein
VSEMTEHELGVLVNLVEYASLENIDWQNAYARDVPRLIAEVRRLRAELEENATENPLAIKR